MISSGLPILVFFVAHWLLSVFCQTFFLHRYGAHRMLTMSKPWERFFHLLTFVSQGSSYLNPRAYAVLHREHHAFSDTERDPHSPHTYPSLVRMMLVTRHRYQDIQHRRIQPEARFEGPEWPLIDRFGRTWASHVLFGAMYVAYYVAFAPSWQWYLLLPVHFLIGPIDGAIVNWCGHKYGYRNFDTTEHDKSRNTLVFDFLTMGGAVPKQSPQVRDVAELCCPLVRSRSNLPYHQAPLRIGDHPPRSGPQRARVSAGNPG